MKKNCLVILLLASFTLINAQSWKLVWADEFSKDGLPDESNWVNETGFIRNNELQYYTLKRTENNIVKKGNLLIIGRKEQYHSAAFTSASLTTDGKHSWTYGKVEARIKLPKGQGLWPAFWMLGQDIHQVGWPACGEIDIMEHINMEDTLHGTLHWLNVNHVSSGGTIFCDVTKYHVYGIEWDQSSVNCMLDGRTYREVNINNNINSTEEFHRPFYIILNMAIGGDWPGSPDQTTSFPDTMYVDYVRVYQKVK